MTRKSLPEEVIIYEILSRLSIRSLMRFKFVCKSWQAIIFSNDINLITRQLQQSSKQLQVLVTPVDQHGSSLVSCHFMKERSSSTYQYEFVVDMWVCSRHVRPGSCDIHLYAFALRWSHIILQYYQVICVRPCYARVKNTSSKHLCQ